MRTFVGYLIKNRNKMDNFHNSEQERYRRAKERVEELKGFYMHLGIYGVFVLVFLYLNYTTSSYPWAIFPIIGWGIGVVGHALTAFHWNPFFSKDWEERKIKEYLNNNSL